MFFLLRVAFWLGLVLVLLPTDRSADSSTPEIGAADAVGAATQALSDMTQFCSRQPAACEVGGKAATVIGQRAQAGARKVYEFVTDKTDNKTAEKPAEAKTTEAKSVESKPEAKPADSRPMAKKPLEKKPNDHTGSIDNSAPSVLIEAVPSDDTLTAPDRAPAWVLPDISAPESVPSDPV